MKTNCTLEPEASTRKSSLLDVLVTMFADGYAKAPDKDITLANLLDDIHAGRYASMVTRLRKLREKDAKAYDKKKVELPAFTMSGTAATRKNPLTHSGFLQVDLDDLGESLPAIREKVMCDPHIAFGFVSPSGDGLKLGFRIDGGRHAESFAAAQVYFRSTYEVEIDTRVKDKLRLCFVSHDPDLWTNPDAKILPVMQDVDNNSSAPCTLQPATCNLQPATLHPATLHNTVSGDSVIANITNAREALDSLAAKNPLLAKLYKDVVEPRIQARAHARNDFVVEAVTFLYRVAAPKVVLELVECFYACNRALFSDSREQHMKDAVAMLAGVANTYRGELSDDELKVFCALDEREQDGFRICRDLALLPDPARDPMTFFLSCDQCATRLGLPHSPQGQRVLCDLTRYGIIRQLTKGTRRAHGVRGEAGTYHWLLAHETSKKLL